MVQSLFRKLCPPNHASGARGGSIKGRFYGVVAIASHEPDLHMLVVTVGGMSRAPVAGRGRAVQNRTMLFEAVS